MSMPGSHPADPVARLVGGAILVCGCLLIDHTTVTGRIALPCIAVFAMLVHRTGPAPLGRLLLAGALFYLPVVFLASPDVALKGLSATVVGLCTVSSLGTQSLHDAIVRIPLPSIVRLLLLQMLHQAEVLRRESLRIHRAVTVRGGVGGMRGVWEFARAIPVVWLPRVLFRAERVGMAMDLREYGAFVPEGHRAAWRTIDVAMVFGSLLAAAGAVWCSTGGLT